MKSLDWVLPLAALASRTLLFAFFQASIALVFLLLGNSDPWHESEGWWAFSGLFTNFVSIALLVWLFQREGKRFADAFRFTKEGWWKDLLIALGLLVLAMPISTFPNMWLAKAFLGSSETAFEMFFRPLPLWAGVVALLFPIVHVFAELPTYFSYAMPRLEKQLRNGWAAWAIASSFLAFQHVAFPLIFHTGFMIWRIGMFIPFAFFIGYCIKVRPRLLPYLMIGHGLMDMMLVIIVLNLSR